MAGLAAARMSGGSEFHSAGPACEKARSPNLVHSRGVTYLLLKPIADQYVLLRCWAYGWCLWDTPGICQCVYSVWSCTVWSQYDSGSAASAAPSGLAWRGRERPINQSISQFIVIRHDRTHTYTREIEWSVSELKTIAMPRIADGRDMLQRSGRAAVPRV